MQYAFDMNMKFLGENTTADLSMTLQVDQVYWGDEADSLALPLVQVLHGGHAVEHLVANHLRPHRHCLPPHLQIYSLVKMKRF